MDRLGGFFKRLFSVAALGVNSVAVRGFHDQIVSTVNRCWITQNRHVRSTNVAAENQSCRFTTGLFRVEDQFYDRGSKHVASIMKPNRNAIENLKQMVVLDGPEMSQRVDRIGLFVERLERFLLLLFSFLVNVFDVVGLDLRTVEQHDRSQIARRRGGIDRAAKSGFVQRREITRVIDVSVGKHNRINVFGFERKLPVFLERDLSLTLIEPTIEQDLFPVVVDQVHGPGHGLSSTPKLNFHGRVDLLCRGLEWRWPHGSLSAWKAERQFRTVLPVASVSGVSIQNREVTSE